MSVSTAKSRISEDINENLDKLKESTIRFYSLFGLKCQFLLSSTRSYKRKCVSFDCDK